ncbi:MAG TPA: hypothetical protein VHK65_03295 [Candidatus Dormibacteraeota bacterium]|nr:hypothetical protein [Candidatus Dormibacteraeota bacterium]
MKRLLLVGLVVVSACGPGVKSGPAATQAASPSAPSSSATAATAGNSPGSLACRLPLADFEQSADYSSGTLKAGFVTFPGAAFTLDPNGAFEGPGTNGLVKSVVKPYLYGGPGVATFTRRFGRWLPAGVAAVSPDSAHYAYAESYNDANGPRSRIHVVDVASAADRVVYDHGFYGVIDYEPEGIYLFAIGYADAPNSGLWRLDPQARSLTPITSQDFTVDYVAGGAAWYSDLAPGDQAPPSMTNPMARAFFKDRLVVIDLKSRIARPWFRRPGKEVRAIGVDGLGHPIVTVGSPTDAGTSTSEELWLVTGPEIGKQIYAGPGSNSPDFVGFGTPLADNHGLWFGTKKGVFLYTPDAKSQMVSTAVGEVAGRCS